SDPQVQVETRWHSVQLIPQVPPEGLPFAAFYEHRLGSAEAVRARQAQVMAAASDAGADIDFARIAVFPNTAAAHALLARARTQLAPEAFEALLQRLFEGYFTRGENLGDATTLAAIAAAHGVALNDAALAPTEPGPQAVSGVPLFVFNDEIALSGAQPAQVLWSAMRKALPATGSEPTGLPAAAIR
ncbi:MAG TPA: DsbA family protein, partial [Variovorax sp.]|nr:DsbA family protein [Variovorax sp.]